MNTFRLLALVFMLLFVGGCDLLGANNEPGVPPGKTPGKEPFIRVVNQSQLENGLFDDVRPIEIIFEDILNADVGEVTVTNRKDGSSLGVPEFLGNGTYSLTFVPVFDEGQTSMSVEVAMFTRETETTSSVSDKYVIEIPVAKGPFLVGVDGTGRGFWRRTLDGSRMVRLAYLEDKITQISAVEGQMEGTYLISILNNKVCTIQYFTNELECQSIGSSKAIPYKDKFVYSKGDSRPGSNGWSQVYIGDIDGFEEQLTETERGSISPVVFGDEIFFSSVLDVGVSGIQKMNPQLSSEVHTVALTPGCFPLTITEGYLAANCLEGVSDNEDRVGVVEFSSGSFMELPAGTWNPYLIGGRPTSASEPWIVTNLVPSGGILVFNRDLQEIGRYPAGSTPIFLPIGELF